MTYQDVSIINASHVCVGYYSRAIANARDVLPQPGLPCKTRPLDRGNSGILAGAD